MTEAIRWQYAVNRTVLVFLRRLPEARVERSPKARWSPWHWIRTLGQRATVPDGTPGFDWALLEAPESFAGGIVRWPDRDLEKRIGQVMARQSVDSLARRADLVIVGTSLPDHQVRVDSVLVGSARRSPILVLGPHFRSVPQGQSILFLKAMVDGSYEVLSYGAGVMETRNGRVRRSGESLDQAIGRIRAAASGRRETSNPR